MGGFVSEGFRDVLYESQIGSFQRPLPTPVHNNGYAFLGWWTTPEIGGFQFFNHTHVYGPRTLYARWLNYNTMSSRELAREIFNRHNGVSVTGGRIYLRELRHDDPPLTNENGRSSYANIRDTAEGNRARTRPFLNDNRTIVPDVFLMVTLASIIFFI